MRDLEILIFDRDCAFCTKSAAWGKAKLKYFPALKGFQELNPADYGLTKKDVESSIWLIRPGKKPLSANEAAAAILRSQPNYFWRLLGHLADSYWIKPFAKQLYYIVARNRHKLPGATESCELPKDAK